MTNQTMPREIHYRNILAAERHDLRHPELEIMLLFGESAFLGNGRWIVFLSEAMADLLARTEYMHMPEEIAQLRNVNVICNAAGEITGVSFAKNDRGLAADTKVVSSLICGRGDLECDCGRCDLDDEQEPNA